MNTELQITPRNLGRILSPEYCPYDQWWLERMRFHPPFDQFGGAIWKQMEQMEQAIVQYHLEQDGRLPKEFAPFRDIVGVVDFPRNYREFRCTHPSGVVLYGEPDNIYELSDGSLCMVDHKTARNKGGEDKFFKGYCCQAVGYSYIAEHGLELGTVSRAGIFYWEVQPQVVTDDPGEHYRDGKFWAPVAPRPIEVDVDYSMLDPLIKEALALWKSDTPPRGREGCVNCARMNLMFNIEGELIITDQKRLRLFGDIESVRHGVYSRAYDRRNQRRDANVLRDSLEHMAVEEFYEELQEAWID